VFESWFAPLELLKAAQAADISGAATRSLRAVDESLSRLGEHGFVLLCDGRVRSRMGELGRELRLVKQRFMPEDQHRPTVLGPLTEGRGANTVQAPTFNSAP
jgi:hypothetical protein